MLELLLSLDHETSKLFDWLEPQDVLELASVNRILHQACEQWCQIRGVPRQVAIKRAEIAGICDCLQEMQVPHRLSIRTSLALSQINLRELETEDEESDESDSEEHPLEFHEPWATNPDLKIGLALLFQSYQGFLEALLRTPLNDTVVNLSSWRIRYWVVSQPRPPAIRKRFDFGYPDTGYWCDAFGCGAPNDYFRLVGDDPNVYWSLCLAGSDAHHIRWRNASNNDRTIDPVPSPHIGITNRKKAKENSHRGDGHSHSQSYSGNVGKSGDISYIQPSDEPTKWDRTRQYWRDCGARVRPSCRWRLEL